VAIVTRGARASSRSRGQRAGTRCARGSQRGPRHRARQHMRTGSCSSTGSAVSPRWTGCTTTSSNSSNRDRELGCFRPERATRTRRSASSNEFWPRKHPNNTGRAPNRRVHYRRLLGVCGLSANRGEHE
jgi:hypothetical protein